MTEAELVEAARKIRDASYAPYSGIQVGAAILDTDGRVHLGCNVENASLSMGLSAEAGALSAMIAAGGRKIVGVAVVGPDGRPNPPCGGGRQQIREFAEPETVVLTLGADGEILRATMEDMLPGALLPARED